jgi:hypothetical protein|tara:strand:+ start:768 stop:1532 length:765 start_codon:yes stop_codon:yes gene_type:complete
MDSKNRIDPSKINKPIQLLGAWLVGLILVNGSFLGAAVSIETPVWLRGLLIIASVINVPIFLFSIFLLQTKFRPVMQEDSYYHDYLLSKTGDPKSKLKLPETRKNNPVKTITINTDNIDWSPYKVNINPNIPGYEKIKNQLAANNIPIAGEFAKALDPEWTAPAIMFGRGFKQENIIALLASLENTPVQYVTYGSDETEIDEYNNIILIGPVSKDYEREGVPINKLRDSLVSGKLTEGEFYSDIITAFSEGYEE